MPPDQLVLCVSAYAVMNPPKLQPLSTTRVGSMYDCRFSHVMPSSRSRSSSSPKLPYTGHCASAPFPLALRLSSMQTATPCCASIWWNKYVDPPHSFLTTEAVGPAYVSWYTG